MNIEAIRAASDREASTSPNDRPMPPDTWDYSQQLRDQLNTYLENRDKHAEAWSDLTTAVTDLDEAIAADEVARRHAARDGKKDPGTAATEKAAAALQFATYRAQELRNRANASFPDALIATEVATRQADFAAALIDRINEATANYQTAVSESQTKVIRAENRLTRLRDEILWARDKFKGITLGSIGTGYDETRWPGPVELETAKWIHKLEMVADHAAIATYPDGSTPSDH